MLSLARAFSNKNFSEDKMYKHYANSVGNNYKHLQITTKYRKAVISGNLKTFCKVAIEESCKRHKIEIVILQVLEDHIHMIVDCPRTMCDAKLVQLIKGFSSYLLFRLCPSLKLEYWGGAFWSSGYFLCSIGADFDRVFEYVRDQELHH